MSEHYDRDGNPITYGEYVTIRANDTDRTYQRVALDKFGDVTVSTVWLGLDHNYVPGNPPLIFETLAYRGDYVEEIASDRYPTLAEALAGHEFYTIVANLPQPSA
jgi:hypothetical protein